MDALLTPQHQAILRQFLRFGSVGFAGFLLDNAIVYGLRHVLGLVAAALLSYLLAATLTWALNRIWTFRGIGSGSMLRQWLAFLTANGVGFVLNRGSFFLLVALSPLCARNPVLPIFAGTLAGMFVNFHLSRRLVFK